MALLSAYVLLSEGRFVSQQNLFTFGEHFRVQNTPCHPFQQCFHDSSGKAPPSGNLLPEKSPRFLKNFDEFLCSTLRKPISFAQEGAKTDLF